MKIRVRRDGGATLRLNRTELVGYYNLANTFLRDAEANPGVQSEWLEPLREQHRQLAAAIGMRLPDPP